MRFTPLLALAALLAGVLYAAGIAPPVAHSQAPVAAVPTAAAPVAAAPVAAVPFAASLGSAAQQIFLDPLTGQQREPTADELAQLRAATAASAKSALRPGAAAPEEIHLPDGTVGVRLSQQYYDTIVVCRQADGRFNTDCPASRGAK
jgi:hypothetical protein